MELYLITELLKVHFNYCINLDCYTFNGANPTEETALTYSNPNSQLHFIIWNVGNDTRVSTFIINRQEQFLNNGANFVIGVRDMYCSNYKNFSSCIDLNLNCELIKENKKYLEDNLVFFKKVKVLFAIMEIEAWVVSFNNLILEYAYDQLTENFMNALYNLQQRDPENTLFKPSQELHNLLHLVGLRYVKKQVDQKSIVSNLRNEDIQNLLNSTNCKSFNKFFEYLNLSII